LVGMRSRSKVREFQHIGRCLILPKILEHYLLLPTPNLKY